MTEHNYRKDNCRWGWTILEFKVDPDANFARVEGIGKGLRAGDIIITRGDERETVSEIVEIAYERDPKDWWKAKVKWLAHRIPGKVAE